MIGNEWWASMSGAEIAAGVVFIGLVIGLIGLAEWMSRNKNRSEKQ